MRHLVKLFLYYLFTLRHFCNPWHIFIKFLFNVILYLIILYKLTDYIYLIVGMKVAFVKSNEKAIKIGYAVLETLQFLKWNILSLSSGVTSRQSGFFQARYFQFENKNKKTLYLYITTYFYKYTFLCIVYHVKTIG